MSECVSFDLVIDVAAPDAGLRQLISVIKPDWDQNSVESKRLSGGCSCTIFRCFPKSNPHDSITVRCGSVGSYANKFNPELEKKIVKEAAERGFFPPVYAEFKNGYCFEYIHGEPICIQGSSELRLDENLIRLIGIQVANLHSVVLPGVDYSTSTYFAIFEKMLRSDYTRWDDVIPSQEDLLQELRFVEELCGEVGSPLVLSHGDVQPGNIIKREEKDEVVLIDWEVAHIGPRGGDLAYAVYVLDFLQTLFQIPKHVPEEELIEEILCKSYLQRCNELNEKSTSVKNEDFQRVMREIKTFKLGTTFRFMCFSCLYTKEEGPFEISHQEILRYVIDRYLDTKNHLVGFRTWGKKPSV